MPPTPSPVPGPLPPGRPRAAAPPGRLDHLDGLRGLAALGVALFFHYVHFVPHADPSAGLEAGPSTFPLAWLPPFGWLFAHGWALVDLFFLLSGVVFAHAYGAKVRGRRVSAKRFFVLRFTRLYPIHLVTLLVMAVLGHAHAWRFGAYPIYEIFDLEHFLLNLGFLQAGLFEEGESFNGPSWSLSIEALCYALFFAVALVAARRRRLALAHGLLAAGAAILALRFSGALPAGAPLANELVARGLIGFFAGYLYRELYSDALDRFLGQALLPLAAGTAGVALAVLAALDFEGRLLAYWALFAAALILVDRVAPLRAALSSRLCRALGAVSLSVYLWHVPVQVVLIGAFEAAGRPVPAASPWFFAAYAAAVLTVAFASHRLFEVKAQDALRRRWLKDKPKPLRTADRRPAEHPAA